MYSNMKKRLIVNCNRITPPLVKRQVNQDKALCISSRYMASGIVNDQCVLTAIMEYEEEI